jgi:hypothetical protein
MNRGGKNRLEKDSWVVYVVEKNRTMCWRREERLILLAVSQQAPEQKKEQI